MTLTLWKKSKHDRSSIVSIEDSVWGTLPDSVLQTLFSGFSYTENSFEISVAEADRIRGELQNIAWNKLVDWLAQQEHSTVESKDYLKRHQFHSTIIGHCLSEALEKDYLNDERYCRLLIESLYMRQKSPVQIKSKLIEKRMPSSLWQPLLQELSSPEQADSILETQAQSIITRYASLEGRARFEKCLTALYRKGFDLETTKEVLHRLLD